ncbi:DsbA family protein [Gluconobacter morbifer]|uniref:Putative thiol:disulfide interchange protein n=1 Tax=Gluconobacter morbifer G707 TaxID=1088869 RepID=G6XGU7_9PROT|nr:thioredoxin domain-containing protein [Gluconobacter morbifer]EHH69405.1 putative thiol:disulfide interchange protein [Gluconobacter morbifer G707]
MPSGSFGRRAFLTSGPAIVAVAALPAAKADSLPPGDPRMGPRMLGAPDAKVLVEEWFSLTCSHCAHFAKEIFPQIQKQLIDTGKIRYRFHDFPLDQVALLAAMVARSLPAERYEPFVQDLLVNQDQWAFARDIDPVAELKKRAALAGIGSAEFDKINADNALREAIVNRQDRDGAFLQIKGTPYFRFNDKPAPDVVRSYDDFAQAVAKAS